MGFLGIDFGVAFGVFASIVLFIQRAAKPHYSILGRVVDSSISEKTAPIYRSVYRGVEGEGTWHDPGGVQAEDAGPERVDQGRGPVGAPVAERERAVGTPRGREVVGPEDGQHGPDDGLRGNPRGEWHPDGRRRVCGR